MLRTIKLTFGHFLVGSSSYLGTLRVKQCSCVCTDEVAEVPELIQKNASFEPDYLFRVFVLRAGEITFRHFFVGRIFV